MGKETKNYFTELNKIKCEVEKKNWLNYISWADAWAEVKKIYPNSNYTKIKNELDNSYLFKSWTWWSVEVEVEINWITHKSDLAITDFKNQEIKYENIKSTDIQNTLQRAFAKAIAMHWIWLYVYRWEDLPEDYTPPKKAMVKEDYARFQKSLSEWKFDWKDINKIIENTEAIYVLSVYKERMLEQLKERELNLKNG